MGDAERTFPAPSQAVAVVTDSTTYLPPALIERWSITPVSLYVGWDGDLRPEHEYVDLDAFYARLRDSPQLPKTSQPSVGDFLAVYRPLLEQGRDVVSLHIAEALSGTAQSASEAAGMLAAEGFGKRVSVHDAQTGAGGLVSWCWSPPNSLSGAAAPKRSSRGCAGRARRSGCGSVWTRSST